MTFAVAPPQQDPAAKDLILILDDCQTITKPVIHKLLSSLIKFLP
jgi:ATP/maltotriose-dependent transcriptional regulator MalT